MRRSPALLGQRPSCCPLPIPLKSVHMAIKALQAALFLAIKSHAYRGRILSNKLGLHHLSASFSDRTSVSPGGHVCLQDPGPAHLAGARSCGSAGAGCVGRKATNLQSLVRTKAGALMVSVLWSSLPPPLLKSGALQCRAALPHNGSHVFSVRLPTRLIT